ncbi:sensor histidine kinase [Roseomonas sp. BN140053]|uniref:sensor histidine kinase n=1 Tax=Roseomonas sp. BN140053 TaxID=3391898 RepID=UPI0039EB8789
MDLAAPFALPLLLCFLVMLGLAAVCILQARRARVASAAQAELGRLAADRSRRLSLLAREIAQPGLVLLGIADRLDGAPEGAWRDSVPALRGEAARLLQLSDEISDELAAQSQGRALHLREEALSLSALLDQAMDEVRRPLGEGARHWQAAPELADVQVMGDRRALGRALVQVLARAVRDTGPGDCISLRVVRGPDALALVVEDEGAGMPPGDLGAGLPGGSGTRGLALGLATARDLVRAHGGDLQVEAAAGIGTRAWLTFPLSRIVPAPP